MKTLKPHYSDKQSRKFWALVNSIKGVNGRRVYQIACRLQECEAAVLRAIAAEKKTKRSEPPRRLPLR